MLFNYQAIDDRGNVKEGSIDAVTMDIAISSLQRRGFVISSIEPADKKSIFEMNIGWFDRVKNKDIVILSRQIATLFQAQVSALRVFRLLGAEAPGRVLQGVLNSIADDIQGGSTISTALNKHPKAFSSFYVNMVKAGEESGRLDQTFLYLADYMDRTYEVSSKAKNALIYPAFVIFTFLTVMVLMLTLVIPKITSILTETGQDIPIYTKIVIGLSDFFVNYGVFFLLALIGGGFFLFRWGRTEEGGYRLDQAKLETPYIGDLYRKLYLSRLSDNLSTMLLSGIPMVRALEITASVVGSEVYSRILLDAMQSVQAGKSLSESFGEHTEVPGIVVQMIKVGEETGELGNILTTLAKFYSREVNNAVDTLIGLIEPALIVALGVGVGGLLASVLLPIYNVSQTI